MLARVAPAGGTCGTVGCWKELPTDFKYTDKELTPNAILQVSLKAGVAGKAAIKVKGKGSNLAPPALPFAKDPRVTVQLQNSDGQCWEAAYSAAKKNETGQFSAKSD